MLDPGGYGRVIRDGNRLVRIVEHVDATPAERAIHEVWLVATVFRRKDLFGALPLVGDDNRQHEYYLNDIFPILLDKGERVSAISVDTGGVMGLNSRGGLAAVTRVVRERINDAHLANGVTLVDPDATYIDVGVRIGADTAVAPAPRSRATRRSAARAASVRQSGSRTPPSATARRSGSRSSRTRATRDVTVGPFARLRAGRCFATK